MKELIVVALTVLTAHATDVIISNASIQNGAVQLHVTGPNAMVYSLDRSADLRTWRTMDFLSSDSGNVDFTNRTDTVFQFYRVRVDAPQTQVRTNNYRGWTNSFTISNSVAEVQVVPTVARIMHFRFSDSPDGPFWENPAMFGQQPSANSWNTTGSFGGDKAWPAPQSLWNWPPPRGFDSMSFTGVVMSGGVTVTGPVDPTFGMRVVREITLHPTEPIMKVVTRFEKISGAARNLSIWTITQVQDAAGVFIPVPQSSVFTNGYVPLGSLPAGFAVTNGLISLERNPAASSKIGSDSGTILWVGTNDALLIESPRVAGLPLSAYPDSGSSAEVYTNPDPVPYLELEFLDPIRAISTNGTFEKTSIYTLFHRTESTPLDEARRLLSR